jgi:putative Mn2+ efflux pump MntP
MPPIKGLVWSIGSGVAAILGTLLVTSFFESAEDGAEALEKQFIETIVDDKITAALNVTLNGETVTVGEALSKIHTEQVAITAGFEALTKD